MGQKQAKLLCFCALFPCHHCCAHLLKCGEKKRGHHKSLICVSCLGGFFKGKSLNFLVGFQTVWLQNLRIWVVIGVSESPTRLLKVSPGLGSLNLSVNPRWCFWFEISTIKPFINPHNVAGLILCWVLILITRPRAYLGSGRLVVGGGGCRHPHWGNPQVVPGQPRDVISWMCPWSGPDQHALNPSPQLTNCQYGRLEGATTTPFLVNRSMTELHSGNGSEQLQTTQNSKTHLLTVTHLTDFPIINHIKVIENDPRTTLLCRFLLFQSRSDSRG